MGFLGSLCCLIISLLVGLVVEVMTIGERKGTDLNKSLSTASYNNIIDKLIYENIII